MLMSLEGGAVAVAVAPLPILVRFVAMVIIVCDRRVQGRDRWVVVLKGVVLVVIVVGWLVVGCAVEACTGLIVELRMMMVGFAICGSVRDIVVGIVVVEGVVPVVVDGWLVVGCAYETWDIIIECIVFIGDGRYGDICGEMEGRCLHFSNARY